MSGMAERRLITDLRRIESQPPDGITAAPTDDNILIWNAVIYGPVDCPFQNGVFKIKLTFPTNYPNNPPQVRFDPPIFHPNVYTDGNICVDVFANKWKPTYDVYTILTFVQTLLDQPNPNSPANTEAARLYRENKVAYNHRVRENVRQTWRDN